MTIHDAFHRLSDEEWRNLLRRSIHERAVDGVTLPAFPDEHTQVRFTNTKWDEALDEAFAFFEITKRACARLGAPLGPTTRLLDFGVGWGRIVRMFMKDVPGDRLFGVDVDPRMVEMCRSLLPAGAYLHCAHGSPLPFADGTFDVAESFSVFSHLAPATHMEWLCQLHRVLRPGGVLVLTTLSRSFIGDCLHFAAHPELSDWHRRVADLITTTFPDWRREIAEFDPERFFYLPAGGGHPWTSPAVYGLAVVTLEYARRHWTDLFEIAEHGDDPARLKQAYFVLRKR